MWGHELYVFVYECCAYARPMLYDMFLTSCLERLSWSLSFLVGNGIHICQCWIIGRYFRTDNQIDIFLLSMEVRKLGVGQLRHTNRWAHGGRREPCDIIFYVFWNYHVIYYYVGDYPKFYLELSCDILLWCMYSFVWLLLLSLWSCKVISLGVITIDFIQGV